MTPLEIPKDEPIPEGARIVFETEDFYYVVPDRGPEGEQQAFGFMQQ